jgi:hypothetical protein
MIHVDQIEGFDWDDGNQRKSEEKHGVSQAEAEQVFFGDPLFLLEYVRHSHAEPRFHALGKTQLGRLLHITFTTRAAGKKIRVISARDMTRKEKAAYEENS